MIERNVSRETFLFLDHKETFLTPIRHLSIQDLAQARTVLALQRAAYQVEAELIGSADIPPLHETLAALQQCGEIFYGYWLDDGLAGAISYKRIPASAQAAQVPAIKKQGTILDIYRLIVHPCYFRRGIGRALLQFVENLESDIERLIVSTGRDNLPAKRLYTAAGFSPVRDEEIVPGLYVTHFEKRQG
jgi:ribosomal protein S18 acetylase RimI-like enzyme